MPFTQQISPPVEPRLGTTKVGIRQLLSSVEEIDKLHEETKPLRGVDLSADPIQLPTRGCDMLDIQADIDVRAAAEIEFTIRGIPVVYDVQRQRLPCCERTAPLSTSGDRGPAPDSSGSSLDRDLCWRRESLCATGCDSRGG